MSMLLMLGLIACSDESSNQNDDEESLKEINVMLDWYPNAVHSLLYVAEEKGYFEEEVLDVSIEFPANTTDPINFAASGKVTLDLYYQPYVIMFLTNKDIPITSVGE